MKKRPILIVLIGFIIGIIWGLYFSYSIVLFYIPISAISYFLYKKIFISKKNYLFSIRRYFRYLKLFISFKSIIIIIIVSIFSNVYVLLKNEEREYLQKKLQEEANISLNCVIVSEREDKDYYIRYKAKVKFNKFSTYYFYLNISKNILQKKVENLEYGDLIIINGNFIFPSESRNFKGFNYNEYLKQENILGVLEVKGIKLEKKNQVFFISKLANYLSTKMKNKVKHFFSKDVSSIINGLILGDTSNIQEEIQENFRNASLSHILAVSGTHMSYLILGISLMLGKVFGKRKTYTISVFVIIFYLFMIGFSASIVRASIMGIMILISKIFYFKNDFYTSISFSLLILLIINPFIILNIGLQLSYAGTIGIVLFQKYLLVFLKKIYKSLRKKFIFLYKLKIRYVLIFFEFISVTLSAEIFILPLIIYHFNIISVYFLISNLLVNIIVGPIMISGFLFVIMVIFFPNLAQFISFFLNIFIKILLLISNIGKIPFSKIYVKTPNIFIIFLYYLFLLFLLFFIKNYFSKNINQSRRRLRNLVALLRYKLRNTFNENLKKIKIIVIIVIIIIVFFNDFFRRNYLKLEIHFLDVGQGDATFIRTPKNTTILIDSGGSYSNSYDVGKDLIMPYLFDRGYTSIDYVFISHFDQDHCGGLMYIMKELNVKNIIIGKQFELSENYNKFLEIAEDRKIKIFVLEAEKRIEIENDLYFEILWPDSKNIINENSLNNNSLVCKMYYKNFSMLFTGDIEKVAENAILEKYKDNLECLKSTVLKIAHHGSNTSTINDFLDVVSPQIALIGVGEDNKFGHPSDETIKKLTDKGIRIYRTDKSGEITIKIKNKKLIVEEFIN